MRSKFQNSTFSEHGHVADQIRENQEFSNMVAGLIRAQNDDGPLNGPMAHITFKYMQISKFYWPILNFYGPFAKFDGPKNP